MKHSKYKIVLLSDLKETSGSTLKSTICLAKMIGGDIDFFHVKNPTEVVERENQLSAMRNINEKHIATENEIQTMIAPISEEFDVKINYAFTFGNVKDEIQVYINEKKPDIIVLGKRKPRIVKFLGDSITNYVLKNYNGVVMIASDTNALEPNRELSLGVLNDIEQAFKVDFAEDLMVHTQKPLTSFRISNGSNEQKDATNDDKNIVEYVFERGDGAIKNLSKYLSISNINLLLIDRFNTASNNSLVESDLQNALDELNVSLLLSSGTSA
jgi:nucleotide-binding universal stress UspA family protein